jgi:hypothetical protein
MGDHPIDEHIERFIGKVDWVNHELSPITPVHVHHVPPSKKHPYHALATEGVSYEPLSVKPGDEPFRYLELMMLMPKSWRLDKDEVSWPIYWLRHLGKYVHQEKTYFAYGHTFGNGPELAPLAPGLETCAWIFLPPIRLDNAAQELPVDQEHVGRWIAIVPIFADEYRYIVRPGTQRSGLNDVLDGFERHGVSELYDPNRQSVLKEQ